MSRKLTAMVLENQHTLALSNHDGSGAEDPMLSNFTVVVLENQNTLVIMVLSNHAYSGAADPMLATSLLWC